MKTYIQKCKEGIIQVNEKSFDDFIDYWHTSEETRNISLHDAIGISFEEYGMNILNVEKMIIFLEEKIKR
jgi:hypothetical protein